MSDDVTIALDRIADSTHRLADAAMPEIVGDLWSLATGRDLAHESGRPRPVAAAHVQDLADDVEVLAAVAEYALIDAQHPGYLDQLTHARLHIDRTDDLGEHPGTY